MPEIPSAKALYPYDLKAIYKLLGDYLPALSFLFVSHGYSFVKNFILGNEKEKMKTKHKGTIGALGRQMFSPYKRIVVMHVTIIASGFFVMALKMSFVPVLLLVLFKSVADNMAHNSEHDFSETES